MEPTDVYDPNYFHKVVDCQWGCPAHTNVPEYLRLTPQGQEVRRIVDALYQKHVKTVEQVGGISGDEFATLNKSLHRLERFWTDQILYRL